MVLFLGILMGLKDPRFKSCERIYRIDFSLFLKTKSLDMLKCLSGPNCKLPENILDTFCAA